MAIAESVDKRAAQSGFYYDNNWTPSWTGDWLGHYAISVVAVMGDVTISGSRWTQIGSSAKVSFGLDTLTFGAFYQYEPGSGTNTNKIEWGTFNDPGHNYSAARVGFSGISTMTPIITDLGVSTGTSATLTAQQGYSAGQAGDLVFTVAATMVGTSSGGTNYGVGAWTGGLGAAPTTTYNTALTGNPLAIRLGGAYQSTGGQAVGGFTAPFTGHSGAAQPKLWAVKAFIFRAETPVTRRSFIYV